MPLVKVKLLKPLDGKPEGETAEYERADADRLVTQGAVEIKAERAPANKAEAAPQNKADAFDHDGDGVPGGSLRGTDSTRARGAARKGK